MISKEARELQLKVEEGLRRVLEMSEVIIALGEELIRRADELKDLDA